jgi:hypothetical protein
MIKVIVWLAGLAQFMYFFVNMLFNTHYRIDRSTAIFACLFTATLFGTLLAQKFAAAAEKHVNRLTADITENRKGQ